MNNKWQVAGGRGQGAGDDRASRIPHLASRKRGFTLVEMLLSMVISVMVFAAMGRILVKTVRLWHDGAGQFYLANQARGARARLLSGGIDPGPGTGLLSINEIKSIKTNPQWCTVEYQTAARDEKFTLQGSIDGDAPADKSIFIKSSKGGGQSWLMMVGVKRGQQDLPDVKAYWFDVTRSGKTLNVHYILSYETGGKTYDYPQVIQAYMVNQ